MTEAAAAKVRLFAALDVPTDVRRALAEWAAEVTGAMDRVRLLAPETFHVTLCFLGWREAADAERIGPLVAECASPVPGLALTGAAWLPPRRPRVLVAEIEDRDAALAHLQGRMASVLAEHAGYEPERRPYRPHVTVARARGGKGDVDHPPQLVSPPDIEFAGAAVTLYRSHLRQSGARYEPVVRAPL